MDRISLVAARALPLALGALALSIGLGGCAQSAWQSALSEDTPAAYHRYLRDQPDSGHSREALERLAFHELMNAPALDHYREFLRVYPNSSLADRVAPLLEAQAFEAAVAENTAKAYRDFLRDFPSGERLQRAAGNAVYLEASGFGGDPAALAGFARDYPQSDHALEARRTVETLALRDRERIGRLGLRIQIRDGVPEADKLRSLFHERAAAYYESADVELVSIGGPGSPSEIAAAPDATLTIRYSEDSALDEITGGASSKSGKRALTRVLVDVGDERIWEVQTSIGLAASDVVGDDSQALSPAVSRYWQDFFVPVVSWPTRKGVREGFELPHKTVAVDATADRAVVLFESGGLQVFGLSDPARPLLLAEYVRNKSFDSWRGVRILDTGIAIFGEDGHEIIGVGEKFLRAQVSYGRGQIGSIVAIEPLSSGLLLAGSRGLVMLTDDGEPPQRLLRRVTRALARDAEVLFFSDGEVLFLSSLEMLQQSKLLGQLHLGTGFGAHRIRSLGSWVAVLGDKDVSLIDVSDPATPVVISRLNRDQVGRVDDAIEMGGRIFLLGQRGLQLLDPTGQRVVENISVMSASRITRMGHHLTMVGPRSLQVVDSVPFTAPSVPASLAEGMH